MTINDKWDDALKELVKAGVSVKVKKNKYLLSKGSMVYTVHAPHKSAGMGKAMFSNLRKFLYEA